MTYDPHDTGPDDSDADLRTTLIKGTFNETAHVDTGTDPTAAGETRLNGTDLKVFSGGGVENLSDIGVGATTLIESQSPSGVSSADFTSSFGNHQAHVFVLNNVIPASGGSFYVRTSTDAGANWDSGASDYSFAWSGSNEAGSEISVGASGVAQFQVTDPSVGSAAGEFGVSGQIAVYGSSKAAETFMTNHIFYADGGGGYTTITGGGVRLAAEDVTGVRFLFDSGNIESGTIEHLGVN